MSTTTDKNIIIDVHLVAPRAAIRAALVNAWAESTDQALRIDVLALAVVASWPPEIPAPWLAADILIVEQADATLKMMRAGYDRADPSEKAEAADELKTAQRSLNLARQNLDKRKLSGSDPANQAAIATDLLLEAGITVKEFVVAGKVLIDAWAEEIHGQSQFALSPPAAVGGRVVASPPQRRGA